MEKYLSDWHNELFETSWRILPDLVAKSLESYIWKVESVPTLLCHKVIFPNGEEVCNCDDSYGWTPPDNTYTHVGIFLSESRIALLEVDEPRAVYYILHELAHAIDHLAVRDEKRPRLTDIRDSELRACKQAEDWAKEDAESENPNVHSSEVADIARGFVQYWEMSPSSNDEIIFQVKNKHAASVGKPPKVDGNTQGKYHGYFENEHGEQAIFVYDRETKSGILWLGDAGWQKPYKVIDGLAPELILSQIEETWLQACWNAATAFEQK